MISRSLPAVGILMLLSIASDARAAAPQRCLDSYDSAQRLRRDGELREAETELVSCSQAECQPELRKDCLKWLEEVRAVVPSIVVHAVDARGCDLVDVGVLIDGKRVADRLDGRAFPLNPGVHTVSIERAGVEPPPLQQRIVLSPGEKNRPIAMGAAPPGATCGITAPIDTKAGRREHNDHPSRRVPALFYVLGGVGIASVVVSSGFYASAWSQRGDLDGCRPDCGRDDVATMQRSFIAADVLLGVGLVTVGVATLLYLTR